MNFSWQHLPFTRSVRIRVAPWAPNFVIKSSPTFWDLAEACGILRFGYLWLLVSIWFTVSFYETVRIIHNLQLWNFSLIFCMLNCSSYFCWGQEWCWSQESDVCGWWLWDQFRQVVGGRRGRSIHRPLVATTSLKIWSPRNNSKVKWCHSPGCLSVIFSCSQTGQNIIKKEDF